MVEQIFGGIGKAIDKVGLTAAKVCVEGKNYIENCVALDDAKKQYKELCQRIGENLVVGGNVADLLVEAKCLKEFIDEAVESGESIENL